MDKRMFLKSTSLLGLAGLAGISPIGKVAGAIAAAAPEPAPGDFWAGIRAQYQLSPDRINLENGYYCIMPDPVLRKYEEHIREVNMQGAYYMRTVQFDNKKKIAAQLAEVAGCDASQLIVTRNTTESLNMVIGGLRWQPGDEAIMALQDYGAMLDMFKQTATRYGVVNKTISVPAHPHSDEEVVAAYERAITPKTKLLMVCHMINITGQILPVRKICDMAHSHGVQVLVDGAHAFAHINFKIDDLNCDYYGCSLHKWLSVPLGAGMLYVRKDHTGEVWPLFPEEGKQDDDITRLNHTGTHPPAVDLTIPDAIAFYGKIGAERKEDRLRYLRNYWVSQIKDERNIVLNSPEDTSRLCAIANVGIRGMKPADMAATLLKKYKIYTVAIDNEKAGVQGCRITPNVYTTTAELDTLIAALKQMSNG
jgi:selenocysteine lyase/cysteine desulfurase